MIDKLKNFYHNGMSPEELAERVLSDNFGYETPPIPIDPFKLMRKYGIVYQFKEFKDLEGIYLVPEDETDIAIVGINYGRPITRQRFTAAHELCHHLKDRKNETCLINSKEAIEKYAECFAAELLMPRKTFKSVAMEYAKDGKVTFADALQIADRFGVSFQSCAFRLAYRFDMLEGDYSNLSSLIKKYRPDKKKVALGMEIERLELIRQAIDSYEFFFQVEPNIVWYQFKNDFIYNENRMEGLDIDEEEVAEIVTDLRINRQNSIYCEDNYEDIIQVIGHASLYDYILETDDNITIYKLLDLNKNCFNLHHIQMKPEKQEQIII